MDVEIKYETIIERCKLLSSFEAQTAKKADGTTMYQEVKMTEKEDRYIVEHLKIAVRQIESTLNSCLDIIMDTEDNSTTIKNGSVIITFDNGYASDISMTTRNSFVKSVGETAASWVMAQWLMDKVKERGEAYMNMYNQMLVATRTIGLKRKKPTYQG